VFAAHVFDPQTMAHVVDPAIADLQAEPTSAARYWAVFKVIALSVPAASMRVRVAAMLSFLTAVAVVALLEIPFLSAASSQGVFDPVMVLYLIPQGLSFALTLGLTVWIVSQFGGHAIPRRAVDFVVAAAVVLSAASFAVLGWVVPPANQAFRVAWAHRAAFPAEPTRGFPELTFDELRERWATALRTPGTMNEKDLHHLAVAYEGRLAAPIAPILFAVFALLIARWRWWARWAGATAVCLAYVAYLLYLNDSNLTAVDSLWFGGAAWYPLAGPIVGSLIASVFLIRGSSAGLTT
jgi:hypothetical protein